MIYQMYLQGALFAGLILLVIVKYFLCVLLGAIPIYFFSKSDGEDDGTQPNHSYLYSAFIALTVVIIYDTVNYFIQFP